MTLRAVHKQSQIFRKLFHQCAFALLVELVELGLETRNQKEKAFFELAERFRNSRNPEEVKQLGDELGRFVFGE